MTERFPLFNWSIRKVLDSEPSSFNRARIKILYLFLLFSVLKAVTVSFFAGYNDQTVQLARACVMAGIYLVMLKVVLTDKRFVIPVTHIMISLGIALTTTNIFLFAGVVNIVTLQFVFMIVLSSFYLLERRFGIIYSILSILPVVVFLLLTPTQTIRVGFSPQELAPPGGLILTLFNFITIVIGHYLYHQAFNANIAEKEELNVQLKAAVEKANRNAQSKSDFLSTMSHELRTPLNSVIGMTELLLHDINNEEQRENLKVLHFSAVSLHTLINDILDFNKLDSDRIQLEEISVNLDELMRNICSGLSLQAKEKGLDLILNVDEKIRPLYVVTDPTRITQVIYNLVGNAIKFTPQGKVTVTVGLLEQQDDFMKARFSITDTGIGIPADTHEAIFEPFVQASSNTTRHFGGTGLGLAIVKRLLALFGSSIRLDSTPGQGTTFSFDMSLPLDKEVPVSITAETEDENALRGLRVLVAEDNHINIFLIKRLAHRWGMQLDIAENGVAVLDSLKASSYDVILMDIHMPFMDGYETARQVRANRDPETASIPIIALTASVTYDLQEKIKAVGMNDYLRKPFNATELYLRLKSYVPRRLRAS